MRHWSEAWVTALRELAAHFPEHRLVVVGAVALRHAFGEQFRATLDIDVCLTIDVASALEPTRFPASWSRTAHAPHRWRTGSGQIVDVIPASHELLAAGEVRWPDGVVMNLVGFDLVAVDQEPLPHLGPNVAVAGPRAILVTKLAAWFDRPAERDKDLADLGVMLMGYAEDTERAYTDPSIPEELDFEDRPAFLLGLDLGQIASPPHIELVERFVARASEPGDSAHAAMLRASGQRSLGTSEGLRQRLRSLRSGLRVGVGGP